MSRTKAADVNVGAAAALRAAGRRRNHAGPLLSSALEAALESREEMPVFRPNNRNLSAFISLLGGRLVQLIQRLRGHKARHQAPVAQDHSRHSRRENAGSPAGTGLGSCVPERLSISTKTTNQPITYLLSVHSWPRADRWFSWLLKPHPSSPHEPTTCPGFPAAPPGKVPLRTSAASSTLRTANCYNHLLVRKDLEPSRWRTNHLFVMKWWFVK